MFLGLLFFPLTFNLLEKFWDRGWILSKTLAIVVISYFVFLLGRLRIFFFSQELIFLLIFLVLIFNLWWLGKEKRKESLFRAVKKNWKTFLFQEGLFFLALVFWSFIRGFQPDIEGLEKFMDFGFLNSILRSKWFPPLDMWFAGEPINYYYFGHLQAGVLTKFSGLDSAVTYNLMIATIFSLVFGSGFSLGSNLVYFWKKEKPKLKILILGGLVSALLLSLGGNLQTIAFVLKNGKDSYWYPDATRFIGYFPDNPNDKTIHEFPSYSFAVADLHGHLNNLPTVLLFLSLLLAFGIRAKKQKINFFDQLGKLLVFGFLLGTMYMTNSWDFPIYGAAFAFFAFFLVFKQRAKIAGVFQKVFPAGVLVLLTSFLSALPFAISFKPMAEGIALVRAHSLWWQLLILWGFFWFLGAGFLIFLFKKIKSRDLNVADIFVFSLILWATILIIIPEIVYVKDIYIPEYHRANTMFKLVYQSFVIYALTGSYIFLRVKEWLREKKLVFSLIFSFIFLGGFLSQMIYPYFAVKGYYGGLREYQGLYGMNFLKNLYPGGYQAVLWLKKNVSGQPVILEAVGDSYTQYNHFSSMTGLPTIEGWLVHEWLWRGGFDLPGARSSEVAEIYQSQDNQLVEELLRKYQIKYLLVGNLEKEKYPDLNEEKFFQWGKEVFSSQGTKIYYLDRLGNE